MRLCHHSNTSARQTAGLASASRPAALEIARSALAQRLLQILTGLLRRLSHEISPLLHSLVTLYPLGILFLDHALIFNISHAFAHILYL